MNIYLLKQIVSKFKKNSFTASETRKCVPVSMTSQDKSKFVEIIDSIGGFYCVMYGYRNGKAVLPPSIDISDKNDLKKIDEFLLKNQ